LAFKNFVSSIWTKFKSSINTTDGWFPFINTQLKWATGFFIRIVTLFMTFCVVVFLAKEFQIATLLRSVVVKDALGIVQQDANVTSSPEINYTGDMRSIDGVVKMLESKKKGTQKDEKAKKDNTKVVK